MTQPTFEPLPASASPPTLNAMPSFDTLPDVEEAGQLSLRQLSIIDQDEEGVAEQHLHDVRQDRKIAKKTHRLQRKHLRKDIKPVSVRRRLFSSCNLQNYMCVIGLFEWLFASPKIKTVVKNEIDEIIDMYRDLVCNNTSNSHKICDKLLMHYYKKYMIFPPSLHKIDYMDYTREVMSWQKCLLQNSFVKTIGYIKCLCSFISFSVK